MDTAVSATFGPYLPVGELGRGGLGVVDLVVLRGDGAERLFAMKRLHPHLRGDPAVRSMFLREARVASLLHHPNIVGVHDVGEDEDGPFLVMDFVDGVSLAQLIRSAGLEELLPVELCALIALQIARGLHAAHDLPSRDGKPLGLVHRDVSPQNVLVGFDGLVRIIDFGVAKVFGAEALTATGILKGKLGYMSPEQLRFEPIDRRADLFALGVLLYEMLASKRLYARRDEDDIPRQILYEPPPDVLEARRDVPPSLVALLFELLAKSPTDRPGSAAEVADRLESVLEELGDDGEPLAIGAYLQERFSHFREDGSRGLPGALAGEDLAPTRPNGGREASTRPPGVVPPPGPVEPRRRRRRALLSALLASAFLLGLLAVLLVHGWTASREAPRDEGLAEGSAGEAPAEVVRAGPEREEPGASPEAEDDEPEPVERREESGAASLRESRPAARPQGGRQGARRPAKSARRSPWMTWD